MAVPKWLRHRNLVAAEALLIAGAGKVELTKHIKLLTQVPNWGKIAILMAMTVGIFGILFLGLERLLKRSVDKTHDVVQALPLPMPSLVIHLVILGGVFYLFALVYGLPVPPLAGPAR